MPRITRKSVTAEKFPEEKEISSLLADKGDLATEVVTNGQNSTPSSFEIPYSNKNIFCNSFGTASAPLSLIFTQGAGGNLSTPAVANFAEGFSQSKKIICFQGRGNIQSRTKMFKAVIEHHQCNTLGGRSMGARASIITAKDTDNVKALILVSYPLRGEKGDIRSQLLLDIDEDIDVLFVIGDKDHMCDLNELTTVRKQMKVKTWIIVVNNANHGMELRPSKATKSVGNMIGTVVSRWIEDRNESLTNCKIHWDEERNDVVVDSWTDGL